MSREELVDAYANGRLSRRAFIRSLVATGVSISAAVAYASALSPAELRIEQIAARRRGLPSAPYGEREREHEREDFYDDFYREQREHEKEREEREGDEGEREQARPGRRRRRRRR